MNRSLAWLRLLVVVFAVCFGVFSLSIPNAGAQSGDALDVTSTTTYVPDIASESVHVFSTYVMVNQQEDEVIGDSVRSFFYTQWIIAFPATVTDVIATSGNQTLQITFEEDENSEDIIFGSIALPFNLAFGQTVTVDVNYTVPGGEPRADGAVARVNESFLSFSVWATGDENQTTVQVEIPDNFSVDLQGNLDGFTQVERDGQQLLEAVNIADPQGFFGRVFGRNDRGLLTESVGLPEATATVRAWPDDPDWAAFVASAIERDVPVIQELTGLEWPAGDIEVIETVTPYLYGYGGWFNAHTGRIEIGENLERDIILHELSHAWFNEELIQGRWITEGLAEEFASRTIEATGDPRPDPDEPDLDEAVRVPLAEWASPWTLPQGEAFAYEQYHYNAAWWVVRQITEDVGVEQFARVLHALDHDEIAYRGDGPTERTQQPTSWTHLYDLLERQAGAEGLDDLFSTYVLSDTDTARLVERRKALARYDSLAETGGDWAVPLLVRRHFSNWEFASADSAIDTAIEILNERDEAIRLADLHTVAITHDARGIYESAISDDDLAMALAQERERAEGLTQLDRQRAGLHALASERNIPISFAEKSLADALAETQTLRESLINLGEIQTRAAARANDMNLVSPPWPEASSADDIANLTSLAEARLATLDAISDGIATTSAAPSLTERVGRLGRDPEPAILRAQHAFEQDELSQALDATADAETRALSAAMVGQNRLVGAGLVGLVAVVGFFVVSRLRRQPSRNPGDHDS